ncbi:hypothetical protein BTJ39_05075 [Izhakiella australiensis]|uniref:Type II secretory pathway, pseudopilin PulG n=1 Tax=Izhakiella australiensis TaxID=1926881 RepID=A0A1S8YRC8_9GAMM|nr:type II secretion system protein [Izhakiella australiensis]OON41337.1 hypothetical protein BTJ39_05075 [Izhakiella australiensis]
MRGNIARSAAGQDGFTSLLLLLALTVLALSMLKSQDIIQLRHRQQQESELLFRGEQIRQAIKQYRSASYANGCYPTGFNDLLKDNRGGKVHYHLRQWFSDPLTGERQWGMAYDDKGRWIGVYSKGQGRPLRKEGFIQDGDKFRQAKHYEEWIFVVEKDPAAPLPSACKTR